MAPLMIWLITSGLVLFSVDFLFTFELVIAQLNKLSATILGKTLCSRTLKQVLI
jgi:hypothetical protein